MIAGRTSIALAAAAVLCASVAGAASQAQPARRTRLQLLPFRHAALRDRHARHGRLLARRGRRTAVVRTLPRAGSEFSPPRGDPRPRASGHTRSPAPAARARAKPCAGRWSAPLPLPPRRGRRPRAAARFSRGGQPCLFPTWQDLCRECHGAGLEQRSPHAGDGRSCAFCHSVQPEPGQKATVTPGGAGSASSVTASRPRHTTPASTPSGAAGLHGMSRPAPGKGPPRPSEARLLRADSGRGHAQSPPQAHPVLRLPRRREAGSPARRRHGRRVPALPRLGGRSRG